MNSTPSQSKTAKLWSGQLTRYSDIQQADELYQLSFGYKNPEYRLNPYLLSALARNAGSTIGVKTDSGQLVGFTYGFSGNDDQVRYHYSQAAVVHPDYQNKGVGYLLKQAQKEYVSEFSGIERMRWAFSPFLVRNAYFNLNKLSATAIHFSDNYYDQANTARLIMQWEFNPEIDPYLKYKSPAKLAAAKLNEAASLTEEVQLIREPSIENSFWLKFPSDILDRAAGTKAKLISELTRGFANNQVISYLGDLGQGIVGYLFVPKRRGDRLND